MRAAQARIAALYVGVDSSILQMTFRKRLRAVCRLKMFEQNDGVGRVKLIVSFFMSRVCF